MVVEGGWWWGGERGTPATLLPSEQSATLGCCSEASEAREVSAFVGPGCLLRVVCALVKCVSFLGARDAVAAAVFRRVIAAGCAHRPPGSLSDGAS